MTTTTTRRSHRVAGKNVVLIIIIIPVMTFISNVKYSMVTTITTFSSSKQQQQQKKKSLSLNNHWKNPNKTNDDDDDDSNKNNKNDGNDNDYNDSRLPFMCSTLFRQNSITGTSIRTAQLWSDHLSSILSASQHRMDVASATTTSSTSNSTIRRNHQLLRHTLTPSMLGDALKVRPRPTDVRRILDILEKYRNNPQTAEPLKILIVGGSVTEGRGCKDDVVVTTTSGKKQKEEEVKIPEPKCTWAYRIDKFVNDLLYEIMGVKDSVRVINAASGGTNSRQGSRLIRYWMYPKSMLPQGPDIIINSYGMNDSFEYTAKDRTKTQWSLIFDKYQDLVSAMNHFMERIFQGHPCQQPMVIYLDDYLGTHSQGKMLWDLSYNTVMTTVMKWYQNMAISSADVVRRIVLANTNETTFTPHWILKKKDKDGGGDGRYEEEVHFGVSSHLMIMWSIAYSTLEAVTSFCDTERWNLEQEKEETATTTTTTTTPFIDMNALYLANSISPPPLTNETMLERISEEWSELAKSRESSCSATTNSTTTSKDNNNRNDEYLMTPCVYAWIAGPEGATSTQGALRNYLKPFITKKTDYDNSHDDFSVTVDKKDGWSRKLGLVATTSDATITFEVTNVQRSVQYVMVDYLKSYGDKWENSTARFTAFVKKKKKSPKSSSSSNEYQKVHEFDLSGHHNVTASLTMSAKENLGEDHMAEMGDDFSLQIQVIGGTSFKITGLMFCNR